ncbi:MAG: hypothetical protein KAU58_03770, partial [Candidatus Omnitrophica bacterium]|nr:hypothetical protein [Candidatus Omnitrophota bacterium]
MRENNDQKNALSGRLNTMVNSASRNLPLGGADMTSKSSSVYLRTFGCQMNVRDSEIVRGMLEEQGYGFVESYEKADIVIFNTCSVREHAEHRAISILASIARKKPRRIFGLIGCVAQHRKESLFKTIPNLDFICGPSNIYRIPEVLEKIQKETVIHPRGVTSLCSVSPRGCRPVNYINPQYRESKTHAYVNIM